ncbi:MAG: hypothetical protein B7X99_05240, partial [Rhizobiales bacterium 17-65-6]
MHETSPPSPENDAQEHAPPSPAAPPPVVISAPQPSADLPAHLERLADRARDYVAAASSANTRRAYAGAVAEFLAWCEGGGVVSIAAVQPLHV